MLREPSWTWSAARASSPGRRATGSCSSGSSRPVSPAPCRPGLNNDLEQRAPSSAEGSLISGACWLQLLGVLGVLAGKEPGGFCGGGLNRPGWAMIFCPPVGARAGMSVGRGSVRLSASDGAGDRTERADGTAGRRRRPGPGEAPRPGDGLPELLAGFEHGGAWDAAAPSAALAAALEAAAGPEGLYDGAGPGAMVGITRQWAAIESWAAAGTLARLRAMMREDAGVGRCCAAAPTCPRAGATA